jgi:hypothetical protein
MRSSGFLEHWEDLLPNPRHKAVFHLRYKVELFALVNAKEQCIKPLRSRNVTANDELLLSVRTVLDPCPRTFTRFVGRIDSLADNPFQVKLAHGLKNVSRRGLKLRRQAKRIVGVRQQFSQQFATAHQRGAEQEFAVLV